VKVVLAGEDVRSRQTHERQLRSIGASTNRPFVDGDSGAPDRLTRVFDDMRMAIENLAHVAVLLFD